MFNWLRFSPIAATLAWGIPCLDSGSLCAQNRDLVRQLNDQLANVAEQASAAVVVISVDKMSWAAGDESAEMPHDLYKDYANPRRGVPRKRPFEGQGSGFILRKDGYILTNNHVVDSASKITVRLKDGRSFPATIQGVDDKTDLAVIKVDAKDLPTVRLGDSDKARVGEFAIAIGAPYSLDYTVDRKSTRLNSSHYQPSRMPSSA